MKKMIYVDGLSGTTGLKIQERLALYSEIELIKIDYEKRRDPAERAKCLNAADLVFLCLPDDAAKEAVSLVTNPNTKIIDASTAHRTNPDWTYGLSELSNYHKEEIIKSKRVSNPGCHATAFNLSVFPLVANKILPTNYPITCHSLTGYSGGGKDLIDKYEANNGVNEYSKAPRPYSLSLQHKHLPEMKIHAGLDQNPVFIPIVCDFDQGLAASVPLHTNLFNQSVTSKDVHQLLSAYYENQKFIKVMPFGDQSILFEGGLDVTACNDSNEAHIFVFGNDGDGTITIMTRLDNLGKGASGAAIQNMNLMLGFEEGLHL